jgi:drug/metabolite transporter (DMT)-like permease
MLWSCASFSLMNVFIRVGAGELPTTVMVMLRNLITVLILLPLMLRHEARLLRTSRLKDHFWRATVGTVGMQSWFYCVSRLPLNQATALSFTTPLFLTLFAVLFLREKADRKRWLALLTGFIGTLVILQPSTQDFQWISLLVVFATAIWAVAGMLVKSLSGTEPALRVVFFMAFFMCLWSLPLAMLNWQAPSNHGWLLVLAISLCSISMHTSQVKAYALVPVVKLMPYDFTRLIFTAFFAWAAFGEVSVLNSWLGAAIIICAAAYSARRDAKAATFD